MKNFTLTLFFLALASLNYLAKAQQLFAPQQYIENYRGSIAGSLTETDVNGSQFLFKDWLVGEVELQDGKKFENLKLLFSVYKNEVYFNDEKSNQAFNFLQPVKSFSLVKEGQKLNFKKGALIDANLAPESFYQVIYDGEIKVFSNSSKMIMETKAYGPSATEKKFVETNQYFVIKNNDVTKFSPNKKSILDLVENKSSEMKIYLDKNKVDFRNSNDLAELFSYYHSL